MAKLRPADPVVISKQFKLKLIFHLKNDKMLKNSPHFFSLRPASKKAWPPLLYYLKFFTFCFFQNFGSSLSHFFHLHVLKTKKVLFKSTNLS